MSTFVKINFMRSIQYQLNGVFLFLSCILFAQQPMAVKCDFKSASTYLKSAIQEANMELIATIDHSELAKDHGLKMDPTHVYLFGNPKAGTPLMISNPMLAIELPLKILVWEKDQHVYLQQQNLSTIQSQTLNEQQTLDKMNTLLNQLVLNVQKKCIH